MLRLWQAFHIEKIFIWSQKGKTQWSSGGVSLCGLWKKFLKKSKPQGKHRLINMILFLFIYLILFRLTEIPYILGRNFHVLSVKEYLLIEAP